MIKQHFIVIKTKEVISRTYGGCTYTLQVYENTGKDKPLKWTATCEACTRGHKGEVSEALTAILEAKAIRPCIVKRCKINAKKACSAYYSNSMKAVSYTHLTLPTKA